MENYKQFFKGKKITVMGLGILGRGLGYTKFLAECGADLIVTDLKTKEQLATSVKALEKYTSPKQGLGLGRIKFVLGEHKLEDFRGRDMIIKAAGVPLDSIYIQEARKNNPEGKSTSNGAGIPIEMDVSLFAKCAPKAMIVGVTGTRGKSMTTTLIYEILKQNIKDRNVYPGGNLRGIATLPLLSKTKDNDIVVCELDSWQLQGFGDAKISPHISVFTTFMPDHMNYYRDSMEKYFNDKAYIYKNQKKNDYLVIRPGMKKFIKKSDVKGKLIVVNPNSVQSWKFNVPGAHHRENLACAVEVAKILGIPESKIKKTVANFGGLEGRMEFLRNYKGIKIYNDNNATTAEATIAGIEALSSARKDLAEKKIVLISGGSDKKLPLDNFVKTINKSCKAVIFIPGTGTDRLIKNYKLRITNKVGENLKDVVKKALAQTKRGDILLFSPGFASFGMFNNEYDRNDQFVKIIRKLK